MSFHFHKKESPTRAIRRVGRKHIRHALACLRHEHQGTAIHDTRKEIKKLRALLQLIRPQADPSTHHKARKALRHAAGHLAEARDARVMIQAFESLVKNVTSQFPIFNTRLLRQHRKHIREFQKDNLGKAAKHALHRARRHLHALKVRADGWPAFEPGLRHTYSKGRKLFTGVRRPQNADQFHEWRKQVKIFRTQLLLLCPEWPRAITRWIIDLENLGDLLGADHDLVLLEQFAAAHTDAKEAKKLNRLILSQQQKLRTKALALGTKIYTAKPPLITRILKNHWTTWRDGDVK